jgi:superfamily II DNA helicase RecQ
MSEIIECNFGPGTKACKNGDKFYVDWDDYERFVKGYRFSRNNCGYVVFSGTKDGLRNKLLHRVIMDCPEGMMIDHIDHDRLNNCRSNLRIVTHQQNLMNKGKYKNNKSGIIGVYWRKDVEKWRAQIRFNNKNIHLGYFDDLEEASKARKDAEIKYFGEFRNKDGE